MRKLLQQFEEKFYLRHQYVCHQGEKPTHLYIIMEGDFEIMRKKKSQFVLMDPTSTDKIATGKHITQQKVSEYLGPRSYLRAPEVKVEHFSIAKVQTNNTLRHGPRGQAAQVRIMIASQGHIFGQDDILNDRDHTISVRCISKKGKLFVMKAEDFLKSIKKDSQALVLFDRIVKDRDTMT